MQKKRNLMMKALAALLVALLLLGAAACGDNAESDTSTDSSNDAVETSNNTPDTSNSSNDTNTSQSTDSTQDTSDNTGAAPDDTPETAPAPDPVELIVFAAASMTDTLEEIALLYAQAAPHVTLIFNFDSSGTLKTQIEEGADVDLFISAAQRQMNELAEIDLVLTASRIDMLENKVALVVAEGNPANITSFDELVDALQSGDILMAMGNSDVPVGQYTIEILKYFDLDEEALARSGVITYGSNVREVTTQVVEASVEVGIVYATDAFSTGLQVVDTASAEMCGGQVIYPAAVMNVSTHQDEAQAFLDYLQTPPAMAVFESVGFSPA